MSLTDHLRELQMRLFRSALAIVAGAILAWFFYDQLFAILRGPFDPVIAEAKAQGKEITLALSGVTDAFTLQLKVSLTAGVILALPVWLYQLWRFIAPGMQGKERRWAYGFVAAATPLFLGGVLLGYVIMPKMLEVLLGFTPANVANIISIDYYLSFLLQVLLFFGFGCLIPLVFVMLNLAGVLTARRFIGWWRGLILGCFVFAAVATPTGDPVTMSLVALPLLGLIIVSGLIMWVNDARRARRDRAVGFGQWTDDQLSPITETVEPIPAVGDDDIT